MSEVKKLKEISDITTGLVVKRKQATFDFADSKTYKMLTLKSFNSDGYLDNSELDEFRSNKALDKRYLTQIGDVIVRLSAPYTSIVINKKDIGYVIPSLFVIIRLKNKSTLSEYLSVFLNSSDTMRYYERQSTGSAIQTIKTSMLRDIKIRIVPNNEQVRITELNKLMQEEKILLSKLLDEKEKYNKAIINQMLKGGSQ